MSDSTGEAVEAANVVDELVEAVALRVVELLGPLLAPSKPGRLLTAKELAELLGVSRDTVYAHAAELGGRPLAEGRRPRLRFDQHQALAAWTARSVSKQSQAPKSPGASGSAGPRQRRRAGTGTDLLPVHGRNEARRAA